MASGMKIIRFFTFIIVIANCYIIAQNTTILFLRDGSIIQGTITHEKPNKIFLKTDMGFIQIKPEDIIGKKVTVLINLAPRALRGVESEGMILMTENEHGKLVFVNPDNTHSTINGLKIS